MSDIEEDELVGDLPESPKSPAESIAEDAEEEISDGEGENEDYDNEVLEECVDESEEEEPEEKKAFFIHNRTGYYVPVSNGSKAGRVRDRNLVVKVATEEDLALLETAKGPWPKASEIHPNSIVVTKGKFKDDDVLDPNPKKGPFHWSMRFAATSKPGSDDKRILRHVPKPLVVEYTKKLMSDPNMKASSLVSIYQPYDNNLKKLPALLNDFAKAPNIKSAQISAGKAQKQVKAPEETLHAEKQVKAPKSKKQTEDNAGPSGEAFGGAGGEASAEGKKKKKEKESSSSSQQPLKRPSLFAVKRGALPIQAAQDAVEDTADAADAADAANAANAAPSDTNMPSSTKRAREDDATISSSFAPKRVRSFSVFDRKSTEVIFQGNVIHIVEM